MTRTGFVIPADPSQPCRTVEWTRDVDLLALLRREIGCRWVETVGIEIDGVGTVVGWVDDDGLCARPYLDNDRFNRFAANLGQPRRIVGTVVLTGDADDEGNTTGLQPELLADLPAAVQGATR